VEGGRRAERGRRAKGGRKTEGIEGRWRGMEGGRGGRERISHSVCYTYTHHTHSLSLLITGHTLPMFSTTDLDGKSNAVHCLVEAMTEIADDSDA
jgi:hypothetical protein